MILTPIFNTLRRQFIRQHIMEGLREERSIERQRVTIARQVQQLLQEEDLCITVNRYMPSEESNTVTMPVGAKDLGTSEWFGKENFGQTTDSKSEKSLLTPEQSVLNEAASTIISGRKDDYGNAEDSFATIAELFSTFLTARTGQSVKLSGRDVAMLNILQKVARDTQSRKRDNLVDIAGYAALAERSVGSDR